MVIAKRTQGRPPRNSGVNGREKLIEATRLYLQSDRKLSLTRTEIAQGCGVTPALISYYFKDKRSLLDAVIKPSLRRYSLRLSEIASVDTDPAHRMRQVIRLLIELTTHDAFLVEYLLRQKSRGELDREDRATADTFRDTVATLVNQLVDGGTWRAVDPALAEVALWGICRALGEAIRCDGVEVVEPPPPSLESRIDFVFHTFTDRMSGAPRPAP